jgi:hypothetical protein
LKERESTERVNLFVIVLVSASRTDSSCGELMLVIDPRVLTTITITSMRKPGAARAAPGLNYYPANAV